MPEQYFGFVVYQDHFSSRTPNKDHVVLMASGMVLPELSDEEYLVLFGTNTTHNSSLQGNPDVWIHILRHSIVECDIRPVIR